MHSNVSYTLVGVFVISLLTALMGTAFWLTLGSDQKTYDRYRVYFQESVAGLNPKATVRYRGVQVGHVASIALNVTNPDQVDVVLEIEHGMVIRRDTIATLSTRGLTGVAAVELSGGNQSPPLISVPNQPLPVLQAGPSLVLRLDDAFNNIVTNVNNLSNRLDRLLSDENQQAIARILQGTQQTVDAVARRSENIGHMITHLETFTGGLASRTDPLLKSLDQFMATLKTSGDVGANVKGTLEDVRAMAQSVRKTADTFTRTGQDVSGLAKDGQRELQRLGQATLPEFNALLVQVGDLAATLQRLADLLERHPRAVLLGKPTGRPGPGEE